MRVSKTQCQGTKVEFTVVLKLYQGTLRQRGVIVGGALSCLAGRQGCFLFGQVAHPAIAVAKRKM
jgi:hypothetical protein